jgi:hypothetical protein
MDQKEVRSVTHDVGGARGGVDRTGRGGSGGTAGLERSPLRGASAARVVVLALLAASALALAVAPVLMPASYSWVAHTTSESAAQGIAGAWLARLGLVMFGAGVLALVWWRHRWPPLARAGHAAFGVMMVAAAAFSARPWQPGAAFDRTEDLLHSMAASGIGIAFVVGVVAVLIPRWPAIGLVGPLAVAASVLLPLGMTLWDGAAGALQRAMFAVAYVWYADAARGIPADGATGGPD